MITVVIVIGRGVADFRIPYTLLFHFITSIFSHFPLPDNNRRHTQTCMHQVHVPYPRFYASFGMTGYGTFGVRWLGSLI